MTDVAVKTVDEKLMNDLKFQFELALGDHQPGFLKFIKAIKSVNLHENPIKRIPLAVIPSNAGDDLTEFDVFPNIMVDISNCDEAQPINARRILKPSVEVLETELACERRSMRWVRGGANTVRKKESVNLARYLRQAFD